MKKTTLPVPLKFGEADRRIRNIVARIAEEETLINDVCSDFVRSTSSVAFDRRQETLRDFRKHIWVSTPQRVGLMIDEPDYEPDADKYRCAKVVGKGDVEMWFEQATYGYQVNPERLVASTHVEDRRWLGDTEVSKYSKTITISLTKDNATIARDIIRRLLPQALLQTAVVRSRRAVENEYRAAVDKTFQKALRGIETGKIYREGDELPGGMRAGGDIIRFLYGAVPDNVSLGRDLHVSRDSVRFDSIYCPPEIANKILKILLKDKGKN